MSCVLANFREVLTQIIRPSFVTKTTTAVHPDGSLKKFGSESQFWTNNNNVISFTGSQILVRLDEDLLQSGLVISLF